MAIETSASLRKALESRNKDPNIVFEIEGVSTIYSSGLALERVRFDTGMFFDSGWIFDAKIPIADQSALIDLNGAGTAIDQQIYPDKGAGSSVPSLPICLTDKDGQITELISPGLIVDDILGKRARVWLGDKKLLFPQDYISIHKGIIDGIDSGSTSVILTVSHPDQKKRQEIFQKVETTLAVATTDFAPSSVNTSTFIVTIPLHGLVNGQVINFDSTGILPTPLSKDSTYYAEVINVNTFYVAKNIEGEHVEFFDQGTGTHTLKKGGINYNQTTIPTVNAGEFKSPYTGPNGLIDSSLRYFLKIDDELIEYTGISTNSFTGCIRGSLGTQQVAHSSEASVESFYVLAGNAMDLALKVMLSGFNDYYSTGNAVSAFNVITTSLTINNVIFFHDPYFNLRKNIVVGDFCTVSGATDPANNFSLKEILSITETDFGVYLEIDGVTFADEVGSSAVASFRSKYDTLGIGMGLVNDDVDILEHESVKRKFLSDFNYEFYLKDKWDGKEFLEEQIYFPAPARAIPRKGRSSVSYHIGPLPSSEIKIISKNNVLNASKVRLKRSINSKFYNVVEIRYDEDPIEDDKFLSIHSEISNDSINRIPEAGIKTLTIKSYGMRSSLSGEAKATLTGQRILNRYQFGAESLDAIEITYGAAFTLEIGDLVLLENDISISNTGTGRRGGNVRLYEVMNKRFDWHKGHPVIALIDTNYSTASRYGLISPASKVLSGTSQTEFIIRKWITSVFGNDEGKKWSRYLNGVNGSDFKVRIRSPDFSRSATAYIDKIVGNTITLKSALGFTPQENDIMELSVYNDMSDKLKIIYAFLNDNPTFDDGGKQYRLV